MNRSMGRLCLFVGCLMLGLLATIPSAASANLPSATASCEGLNVELSFYPDDQAASTVKVTIDEQVRLDTHFGGNFTQFFSWDSTVQHHWRVVVTSSSPDGNADLSGVQEACGSSTSGATTSSEATATSEETTTSEATMSSEATTSTSEESTTSAAAVGAAGPTTTTPESDTTPSVAVLTPVAPATATTTSVVTPTTQQQVSASSGAGSGPSGGLAASGSAGNGVQLPTTGSSSTGPTLMVALGLIAVGAALSIVSWRRRLRS